MARHLHPDLGMVFLMLHLTLYPFPNITHILNPQTKSG